MSEAFHILFTLMTQVILVYFFLINTFYLIFMILSYIGIHRYRKLTAFVRLKELFHLPMVKPISIITPVFNEEDNVVESVKSLLSVEYPLFEVIVVNDGSTDSTLKKLIETFELRETKMVFRKTIETKPINKIFVSHSGHKLVVIDKANGKKADALNAGLNISQYPLFCAIDGDSFLEKDALLKIARPFVENPDETVAAGGIIRLSNGCNIKHGQVEEVRMPRNSLARFQIIEYLRAFLGGRIAQNILKSTLVISGAFGLFRKDIALECGGYRQDTVGEDMDLIIRMQKRLRERIAKYRIYFIPDPICWTEAPITLKGLARQRNRWYRGLIESLFHNAKMLFNPRYGITGLFAMPFFFIFEMLGPLIEFCGYVIFLFFLITATLNYAFAWMFFLLAVVFGTFISLSAVYLEEISLYRYPRFSNVIIIVGYSLMEYIIYRQFLTAVRVKAFFDYIKGKEKW